MNLKSLGTDLLAKAQRHSPEILTGIGIGGFLTSIILAVRATPTACQLLEEKKLDEGRDNLTKKEVIQTTWKCYVPSAITAVSATACIVGAASTNHKRNTALAAAYGLSQETLSLYRQKVVETLGEKKESEIREKTDQEMVRRYPPSNHNIYEINPTPPDTLCQYKGRYFYSTWDKIRGAVSQLGEDMLDHPHEPSVCENDFYELVGLPYLKEGNTLGWHLHINGRPELYPPTCIELEDHRICYVISFRNEAQDIYSTRNLRHL